MRIVLLSLALLGSILFAGEISRAEDTELSYSAGVHTWQNVGGDLKPYFIVDDAGLWPTHQIDVCWVTFVSEQSKDRSLVESAIQTFIEANSDFRFGKNWGKCDALMRSRVQITVADAGGESEVGYKAGNNPTDVTLNFTFKKWNPDCSASEDRRQRCIQTVAVHEFLHALGTLHEQLSPDLKTKDPACYERYKDSQDIFGKSPRSLTEYDPDSIMNYCKDIYATPTHLSTLDIQGLKALSARSGNPSSAGQ